MPEVKCPECGSPMVLRTARRGPNAGGKFYGCSRYPNCKTTVSFESINTDSVDLEDEKLVTIKAFFPIPLFARERFYNYQVRFFESVAVPEFLLKDIYFSYTDKEYLKAYSQWRIDFPYPEFEINLTDKQRYVNSVLEKILTRGRITLISPKIEKNLKAIFKITEIQYSSNILKTLAISGYNIKSNKKIWLDSQEELIFYEDIISKLIGTNYRQFVLPQVEFTSLIPQNLDIQITGFQRVDFAIFHPNLKEKIIVEIDGEQHNNYLVTDEVRDKILQEYGYTVIRIKTDEIRKRVGEKLLALQSKLSSIVNNSFEKVDFYDSIKKFILSIKLAHQIQLVLLQAIQTGFLKLEDKAIWHIVTDLDKLGIFDEKESLSIINESVIDFLELLGRLCKLYSIELSIEEPICNLISEFEVSDSVNVIYISFVDKFTTDLPTFHVQNIYFPYHISNSFYSTPSVIDSLDIPNERDLEYFLHYLFRKSSFWEGQYEGIVRVLQGKDTLLLLPTGAGKSLVYQLVSLILPGRTVVIDPIISLMEDQIDNLAMMGIDRCIAITSLIDNTQDRLRAIQLFAQGEYLFAFIAPERFQTVEFRNSLRTLTVHTPIALIVVDEAHCVSEWGHDFRTSYLNIGRTSRQYCESNGRIPPLLALTGTASRAVLKDIQRELQIEDFEAIITPKSFDRKELKFQILESRSQEKFAKLKGLLKQVLPEKFNTIASTFYQTREEKTYSGLVFCPHVNGDFGVTSVANNIQNELSINVSVYSGKEPNNWSYEQYKTHKTRVTKNFKRNKIPLLVCTKAFGMGIDKPNIRYTIHYGIPPSIESFYQEAGRAGRDKKTAYCFIIVSNDDPIRTKKLLNPSTKIEEINDVLKGILWEENDDITRILYFHTNSFRGIENEKQDIKEILLQLGDVSKKRIKTIPIPDEIKRNAKDKGQARGITEKALHRLLLIGVISDYTIDYAHDEFTVSLSGADKEEIIANYGKYVANYLYSRSQVEIEKASRLMHSTKLSYFEFILEMVNLLLHFIYEVIEQGRRRALYEMLLICENSPTDESIRQRILRYLEATQFSEDLETIINDKNVGIVKSMDIFNSISSPNEAAELRGQVSRYLESYPDHPALLMLRSLSEIFSRDKNYEVVKQNFYAALTSALTNYGLDENITFVYATWAISKIANHNKKLVKELITETLKFTKNCSYARILIKELPIKLTSMAAWFLLSNLRNELMFLIVNKDDTNEIFNSVS